MNLRPDPADLCAADRENPATPARTDSAGSVVIRIGCNTALQSQAAAVVRDPPDLGGGAGSAMIGWAHGDVVLASCLRLARDASGCAEGAWCEGRQLGQAVLLAPFMNASGFALGCALPVGVCGDRVGH